MVDPLLLILAASEAGDLDLGLPEYQYIYEGDTDDDSDWPDSAY